MLSTNRRSIQRSLSRFHHRSSPSPFPSPFLSNSCGTQGHITPEAYDGGPIALVRDGDTIIIDAEKLSIDLEVSDEELARRREEWVKPALKHSRGVLFRYARDVKGAELGAYTD
jgi:dihydroxyacid dehydratase/phosphogluconate dehydratase